MSGSRPLDATPEAVAEISDGLAVESTTLSAETARVGPLRGVDGTRRDARLMRAQQALALQRSAGNGAVVRALSGHRSRQVAREPAPAVAGDEAIMSALASAARPAATSTLVPGAGRDEEVNQAQPATDGQAAPADETVEPSEGTASPE